MIISKVMIISKNDDNFDGYSFRTVRPRNVDFALFVATGYDDAPWIAADFAVLNEAAGDVRLDVDFHRASAVAGHWKELHPGAGRSSTGMPGSR